MRVGRSRYPLGTYLGWKGEFRPPQGSKGGCGLEGSERGAGWKSEVPPKDCLMKMDAGWKAVKGVRVGRQ